MTWIKLQDLHFAEITALTVIVFGFRHSLLTKTTVSLLGKISGYNLTWTALAIDLDENQEAIHVFNIRMSPYLIFVKDGQLLGGKQLPFSVEDIDNAITTYQSS